MNRDKKLLAIEIMSRDCIKFIDGDMYSLKSKGWLKIKPNKLPTGYKQYRLSNRKEAINVFCHIAVYLYYYGIYDDGLVIDHIDGDNTNNSPHNLRDIKQLYNINPSKAKDTFRANGSKMKLIRSNDIAEIKRLMSLGYSQNKIAITLNFNRCAVRYIYNKIKNGLPLKYE